MARRIGRWNAAILAAALLLLAGCQVQLHGGLSENEANVIMAALYEAGLSAEKRAGQEGTFVVFIEETEFAAAVRALDAKGLPRKRYDDLGKIFGKVAMFSTPVEEKARYLYAMQEELSHTVSQIDGVLEARVHLVLPEQDQLGRTIQTPSAAVFIKYVDDERHDPQAQRREIRGLVAASVPNLDEERIVVSFFPAADTAPVAISPPPWKRILGLRVAEDSAVQTWWLLGGAAGAVVALLVALAFVLVRKGKK